MNSLIAQTIQVKNSNGIMKSISPYAFQKQFGVKYTARLLIDKGCPGSEWMHEKIELRKAPNESRRSFFEQQILNINDKTAKDGGAMKTWLFAEQIRKERTANIYIAKVDDIVGHGAFAGENFEQGKMLAEYTGYARAWKNSDLSNAYIFNYVHNAVIDASKRGNVSRFINHSEEDANARYMRIMVDGIEHIIFLAKRKIHKDEQILFNYGEDYWKNRKEPKALGRTF